MTASLPTDTATALRALDAAGPLYATQLVEVLLGAACNAGASDVHLHPTTGGLRIQWRIDGVLQLLGEFSRGQTTDVIARLKVLAGLLTYQTDIPQEGRIRNGQPIEMRVSTFPTLHGERAVVRLFATQQQYLYLHDLNLPPEIEAALGRLLQETSGAVLLTGPAGSGKTTTAYACLREIVRTSLGRRNIVTLEDPVEVELDGVSQSQAQPAAGFTLTTGLRSLMRQDPEVILVGEIRDAETVQTVFQAALTGHLVLSTFHAGSAAGALSRLLDMRIEPYLLTSGLIGVVHQRLVRRLCTCNLAGGCEHCRHTGYRGRLALAEMLPPLAGPLAAGVLSRLPTAEVANLAATAGMTTISQRASAAVAAGQTDTAEVRRVLGMADETAP